MRNQMLYFFVLILTLSSCQKKDQLASSGTLSLSILHHVDGKSLSFDSVLFLNASGELYSVTRLEYYLSSFRLYHKGEVEYSADSVYYINARDSALTIVLSQVPVGHYDSMSFFIGLSPALNMHGQLHPTPANVAMQWPEVMGGGYHFLKFEGHWVDGVAQSGFAIHVGTDPFLIYAGCNSDMTIADGKTTASLRMNVNEWLRNPHQFSFKTDGVYTMDSGPLMDKIRKNGGDVFTLN